MNDTQTDNFLDEDVELLECSCCTELNAPSKMYGTLCWHCANEHD